MKNVKWIVWFDTGVDYVPLIVEAVSAAEAKLIAHTRYREWAIMYVGEA